MLQTRPANAALQSTAVACLAAIAYVDPGNFAVNVAAGAQHGYGLVWVVLAASAAASLVQFLAAKLGVATGMSLAENCSERYRRGVWILLGVQAEVAVVMTDLAELVGGAFALNMLVGLPMVTGAVLVAAFGFVVLGVRRRGGELFRPVLLGLFAIIVAALLYQAVVAGVDVRALLRGAVPGRLDGSAALVSVGIIGATVMPHALHFHSAVSRTDAHLPLAARRRSARRRSRAGLALARSRTAYGVAVAMTLAGAANVSIVLVATHLPAAAGESLFLAHAELAQVGGRVAAALFAIALLASGLASTTVGIYTGQVVMAGFWRWSVPVWVRRALAAVPPLVLLVLGLDATRALVLSQVALSFVLPASLVPLVLLTRRRSVMGDLVNHPVTSVAATLVTAVIIGLDGYLLLTALP
ncbi:MAG TPA: Nramp family divalent metal transporter [Friedmanniella sp.]